MFKSINAKFVFAIVITSFMTFGMMVTIAMADSALPTEVATPVESNDEEVLEDFEEDVEDEGDEGSFFDSLFGDEEDTEIE
ncbi:hypothetical protein KC717_04750, partial [Candidatus Dojkabacteria bacterium]|nr:hypothetical protein [Candidatus Dojkabacteria bacterium]